MFLVYSSKIFCILVEKVQVENFKSKNTKHVDHFEKVIQTSQSYERFENEIHVYFCLCHGRYILVSACLFFVCLPNNLKSYEPILIKFQEMLTIAKITEDFNLVVIRCVDPGIFCWIFYHCEITICSACGTVVFCKKIQNNPRIVPIKFYLIKILAKSQIL